MSDIVIKVEKLSKRYRIGQSTNGYRTLRETLAGLVTAPFRRKISGPSPIQKSISTSNSTSALVSLRSDEISALKDVSFEVKAGEVVGIIGCNGAGKSTLLKVLSRITEPTDGYAEIRGRVGSLLEVGTGFHPELTGRENIYLNGAILGMKKAEIDRRFDEIVAFAELKKFIDTPMKHYSSGMYVRLAFSVAAYMEPEILLVDEVLAVGDAAFQKKCLGKMEDVAREERTILFVSHQMATIKSLCSRAIRIHDGSLVENGNPEAVISHYLAEGSNGVTPERTWETPGERPGNSQVRLIALRVLNASDEIQGVYGSRQPIVIEMEIELFNDDRTLFIGFDLINQNDILVFRSCHNHGLQCEWPRLKLGRNKLRCIIPANMLNNGTYFVAPRIGLQFTQWILFGKAEVGFEIQMDHWESPFWKASHAMSFPGIIAPCLSWRTLDASTPKERLS